MNASLLRTRLAGLPITQIRWFDAIDSTNDQALAWALDDAPDGALVAADSQHQGRGRYDRKWETYPGAALAFSLIFRPNALEQSRLALFSPLGALAVRQSLEKLGLQAEIKWPNDILIDRRKVSGILAEAVWQGQQVQSVVLGIGINVMPEAVPKSGESLFPAGSIEEALGRPLDRFDLLRSVLLAVFEWRQKLDSPEFHAAWNGALAFKGEMVQIEAPGSPPLVGCLEGIDPDGSLILQLPGGQTTSVMVGDVHLRPENQH